MNQQLPATIKGDWIWNKKIAKKDDVYALLRCEFDIQEFGLDNILYITACSSYQLYINERLVGFGPRASHGDFAYVDKYDVQQYLQDGINAISLIVYSMQAPEHKHDLPAGLWCQLEIDDEPILYTDKHWKILEASGMSAPRTRGAESQIFCEYLDNNNIPIHWLQTYLNVDQVWLNPDVNIPVDELPVALKLYPLAPDFIDRRLPFVPYSYGSWSYGCAWTQVTFGERHRDHRFACAAESFIYSEDGTSLPIRLFSDDTFTFFCNRNKVISQAYSDGANVIDLPLEKGWNRLLLLQNAGRNSMGFFMQFPTLDINAHTIRLEPSDKSIWAWRIAGPLQVPLNHATTSVNFELLDNEIYYTDNQSPIDMNSTLSTAKFVEAEAGAYPIQLSQNEFLRARLKKIRYGFPIFEVNASEGDIIDVTIGYSFNDNNLPSRGAGSRATHTLCCTQGLNNFTLFNPREALYLLVTVRKAKSKVTIVNCGIEELIRENTSETRFDCSDSKLKLLWDIGRNTIRRSSAFIPQRELNSRFDVYLLDAYMESVNMVVTYGDVEYSAARLRQFIEGQFSNGDIPALTFSSKYCSQVNHLFFLPIWVLYNYRIGRDFKELQSLSNALKNVWAFYRSLKDEETGMLDDIDTIYDLQSTASRFVNKGVKGGILTYANALYCRFLLSLSEVLRNVDEVELSKEAKQEAKEVAKNLRSRNFDESKGLFLEYTLKDRPLREEEKKYGLFANFATLMGGVMSMDYLETFFNEYFSTKPPYVFSKEETNPYFHFLFMETMFSLDLGEWAITYLRQYWHDLASTETFSWLDWRNFKTPIPIRFFNGSVVSPNTFLMREIAGLRYSDKEYAAVYFNPATENLDWVDLSTNNKNGKLRIRWEKSPEGYLKVLIESNYRVNVLPELSKEELANTEFSLSEHVTLLHTKINI